MASTLRASPSAASVVSSASTSSLPEGVSRTESMEELRRMLQAVIPEDGGGSGEQSADGGASEEDQEQEDREAFTAEEMMERAEEL